jgi:hypothetical protein
MDQNEFPVWAEYIQGDYDDESALPCSQTYHTLIAQRESIVQTFLFVLQREKYKLPIIRKIPFADDSY